LPKRWPGNSALIRYFLRILQEADRYTLKKHFVDVRPDLFTQEEWQEAKRPPWFIKLHRAVAVPFRQLRRKILKVLRFRDSSGKHYSETFVEAGSRFSKK
jgi:hypothetical protein